MESPNNFAFGNYVFVPHGEEVPFNVKVESVQNGKEDPIHLKAEQQEMELETKISIAPIKNANPIVFRFAHCGVSVKKPNWNFLNKVKTESNSKSFFLEGEKGIPDNWITILNDVSDEVRGGNLLAIMGPSGSGKSTLLSLLTLTPTECKQRGYVTLNGHKVDSQLLRNFCSFVPQDDHLWPFLTCRETLSYAADFYLSKSSQEKKAEVDRLIKELGLEKCANTICGNQFLKGLSGGQKRRLSLALALIKNPLVLFLDEPTSGLDSASASWIMAFLNNYVKERGVVVICTIHQPSTAIFKQFDSTMLLSGGRVAYVGPALEATRYFKESFQATMPDDYSPAEFVLEFINSDFGEAKKKEEVEQVLDAWRSRAIVPPRDPPKEPLPAQGCRTTSFLKQVNPTFVIRIRFAR